jgi:hypothetical protein
MDIEVTVHAINRYKECVKPALAWSAARRELLELVEHHGRIVPPPPWVRTNYPSVMELSDGLVLLLADKRCPNCKGLGHTKVADRTVRCVECEGKGTLRQMAGTTVIARGDMTPRDHHRARRRGQQRRWKRKVQRHKPRHDGRGYQRHEDYEQ